MKMTVSRLPSIIILSAALIAAPALAHEAGGVEAQSVIQDQLDAFQRGDADSAFDLASPDLQADFDDAGSFMEIVRAKYAAFFHRRQLEFAALAIAGDTATQGLRIVDDEGQVWNVVYKLTRQPNGAWAVSNCFVGSSGAMDV